MRVLQVIPFFARRMGGPVAATRNLSKELVKKGNEVEILTTDFALDEEFVSQVRNEGVGVTTAKCDLSLGQFLVSPSMKPWLRARVRDFEVIHMHSFRSYQNNVIQALATKLQRPYILQAHGSLLPFFEKRRLKLIYDFVWGKRILDQATAVVALNSMEASQYRSMGVKEDRIKIVPHGICASEFQHLPERGAFRAKFGLESSWACVLYLGRIHKIKGLDLLLAAFASLVKEVKDIRLILAGPDDGFLPDLKKQAMALGVENRVIVTGPLYDREKLEAFIDADVYVLPSQYEIFGITVLEAAACGTPVVVTRNSGIADFVGRIGYVVDAEPHYLAQAIVKAMEEGRGGRRAKERAALVENEFGLDSVVEKLEAIYEDSIRVL